MCAYMHTLYSFIKDKEQLKNNFKNNICIVFLKVCD